MLRRLIARLAQLPPLPRRPRPADGLPETTAHFRAVFEHAPVGIILFDGQGRTLQANRALLDMIGYAAHEVRGLTFRDYSHPDDATRDTAALAAIRAGADVPLVRREKRYRHKDGHAVWVQITSVPVRDAHGQTRYLVTMVENVTERKQVEAALHESQLRTTAILDAVLDGVVSVDAAGRITEINPAAEQMFGRSRPAALGLPLSQMVELDWPADGGRPALAGLRLETTVHHKDGSTFPAELTTSSFTLGDRQEFTAHIRDITDRKQAEAALAYQALHDSLTGLPNRHLLRQRLEQAIAAARQTGSPLALLMLDLDRFKEVNDTLGHHSGDQLLTEVAARLRQGLDACVTAAAADGALVARLGGDEFAVLLPGVCDAAAAAELLLQSVERPFSIEGHRFALNVSIGLAAFPEHGDAVEPLLQHADVAMYRAKRSGGGWTRYAPEDDQHSVEKLALVAELRQALRADDELVLHYQPKVDLASGQVAGVEALARWQHPRRGLLGPDQFIPLAERSGLMKLLTQRVLRLALAQAAAWRAEGLALPVAVNLAPCSLQDPRLADEVAELLADAALEGHWLEVEITESAYIAHPRDVITTLQRLRAMGVRVAIDDFGTGYASLSYLTQLPVDDLKIDRSFVASLAHDRNETKIVQSIIDLAHALGLRVVAEGIEDAATQGQLTAMGCDLAQGYYLGRPAPAAALALPAAIPPPLPRAA